MPAESAAAHAATPFRSRLLAFSLGFLIIMLAVQPAFSATIQTDLWIYQQGDTVTVTGADYGSGETVEIVTTDPNGVEVDRGAASADELGGFTYQFVLMSDVPGIYDVVGTGSTSGLSAATQFDPPPPAPQDLQFVDTRFATASGVTLTWSRTAAGTNCYLLYRSTSPMVPRSSQSLANVTCSARAAATGAYAQILQPGGSTTPTYTDAGVVIGTDYYYYVTAHNEANNGGESGSSNQVATASLSTAPSSHNFGNVPTSTASAPQTFTVTNNSSTAYQFQSVTKSGSNQADFAISGAPAAGTSIAVGGTFVFTVTFTPSASGSRTATLHVNSRVNAGSALNTRLVPVSGNGVSDGAAPVGSVLINAGDGATSSAGVNLRLQATDAIGVTAYRVANGSDCSAASFVNVTSTTALDITIAHTLNAGDGLKTVCAQFRDAAGNVSTPAATDTITLDTVDPTIIISLDLSSPDGENGWYVSDVEVTLDADDATSGLASVEYSLDGGAWTPYTAPFTVSADGSHTVDARASDNAGNQGTAPQAAFMIDQTDPTISISLDLSSPDGENGWYVSDVEVTLDADDATSGLASVEYSLDGGAWTPYTAPFTVSADGSHTVDARASDNAGNQGTAPQAAFMIDQADPTIELFSRVPIENINGWNNTDVTLTWECTDGTSGVVAQFVSNIETAEGENYESTETCEDNAGNTNSDTQQVSIDQTDPTIIISLDLSSPDGENGWYVSDVEVTLDADDATSGLASVEYSLDGGAWTPYTAPFTVSADGSHTVDARASDNAGNQGTAPQAAFMIDQTDPTIALFSRLPDANANGWNNSDVTVVWSCADATSGPVDATVPKTVSDEGAGQFASAHCEDKAGNLSNTDEVDNINIDKTDPTITFDGPSPEANANGWNNSPVTLSWTCTDALSGPAAPGDSDTLSSEGADQSATGTCTDLADNSASDEQTDIDIDLTVPTVTFAGQSPAANANGWNNSAVTLSWTCTDALSGPAAPGDSDTLSSEGADQSATGTCTDLADNSASDTQADIDIDLTDPNVAVTSPADASSTIALSIPVSGSKSDALSGVDSVNVNGLPATLGSGVFSVGSVPLTCGSNVITATAVDKAGNSDQHTINVTRICFSNVQFYSPLDQTTSAMSHPVTNSGKMGRVIPTKVTFKLDDGTVVTDAVAAARGWTIQIGVNNADCDNGGATDSLEAYADAGQSSAGSNLFRWTSGQWMYNLDTRQAACARSR